MRPLRTGRGRDDVRREDESTGVPGITRMPDGIEVLEQKAGRAVGQWILQVRCQCGRRWFEVEEIEATTCPRCGLLVFVEVRARG